MNNVANFRFSVFCAAVLFSSALFLGACNPSATTPLAADQKQASPTATDFIAPTLTPASVVESTSEALCPPLDSGIRSSMYRLEEQVVRLRGMQPTRSVERGLLAPSQLRERIEEDFLVNYTKQEAARDALLLSLLDLIEPGLDLHNLYTDLLSEQIAGFYDSQEDEMLVICGAGFGGLEAFTYVHEYVHALQDQTYGLEDGLNYSDEACELDGERCFALRALIEGDASLLQEQWLRTFADAEILESLISSLGDFDSPVFEAAPAYIQAELTFPYLKGLAFVRSIYLENDWAGVDVVFKNPPVSSEQILHPELYPRDIPISLTPPSNLNSLEPSWEITLQDVLGEWATRQVLLTHLPEETAILGAGGWGGDLVLLFEAVQDESYALVLITQWDTMRDAHEFASSFFEYGETRFGQPAHRDLIEATWVFDGGASQFLRQSNQTRWIVASDGDALSLIQSVAPLPLSAGP